MIEKTGEKIEEIGRKIVMRGSTFSLGPRPNSGEIGQESVKLPPKNQSPF